MFDPNRGGCWEERLQGGGVMVCSAGTTSFLAAIKSTNQVVELITLKDKAMH